MGKMAKIYDERTVSSVPDINANIIRVYKAPNNEVTIHFRNMKIVLHTPEEIAEWRDGFREALNALNNSQ